MFLDYASRAFQIPRRHSALAIIVGLLAIPAVPAEQAPKLRLQIGMHFIQAEVAATPESLSQGLMHRTQLGKNNGMLFIFENSGRHAMWMRNTPLPLSVAFIDDRGIILNIEEMEPLNDTSHSSVAPAKYALEMNRGWFAKRTIKAGDEVKGLPR